ncbi:tRNA1(Val) (adenine(37)-N6)-methyltransferase [Marinilabilia sp.]
MFHFQQFSIKQERAAMKVGTDGVLLGSWAPVNDNTNRILDLGTGTGLIALMLAQRSSESMIDAVEIDEPSAGEALVNFQDSPWSGRLTLVNDSFQSFSQNTIEKYDLVTCNPPFFSNGVRNNCDRKATARHNDVLSQEELISGVLKILAENGNFCLILPVPDFADFKFKAARSGLFEHHRLSVKPTPQKPVKRILSCWKKHSASILEESEMVLELSRHNYSDTFRKMTSEFYLK